MLKNLARTSALEFHYASEHFMTPTTIQYEEGYWNSWSVGLSSSSRYMCKVFFFLKHRLIMSESLEEFQVTLIQEPGIRCWDKLMTVGELLKNVHMFREALNQRLIWGRSQTWWDLWQSWFVIKSNIKLGLTAENSTQIENISDTLPTPVRNFPPYGLRLGELI